MSGEFDIYSGPSREQTRRRTLQGERLVTPLREFSIGGERLRPGIDRFAVDHAFVQQRPERFEACLPGDPYANGRLRGLIDRTLEELERGGPTPATASSRGPLNLPT